jgi:hypothetical protein
MKGGQMRVLARLLLPVALGAALCGSAFAEAPAPKRDNRHPAPTGLKAESVRAMAPGNKVRTGWPQNGIAINPWIVPTFK